MIIASEPVSLDVYIQVMMLSENPANLASCAHSEQQVNALRVHAEALGVARKYLCRDYFNMCMLYNHMHIYVRPKGAATEVTRHGPTCKCVNAGIER